MTMFNVVFIHLVGVVFLCVELPSEVQPGV